MNYLKMNKTQIKGHVAVANCVHGKVKYWRFDHINETQAYSYFPESGNYYSGNIGTKERHLIAKFRVKRS